PVAAPGLGRDEPLGRRDLAVLAGHADFGPIRVAPDEAPGSAHAQIALADWHRRAFGAEQPLWEVLGARPRLPEKLAWRVERADGDELAVRRRLVDGLADLGLAGRGHVSPFSSRRYSSSRSKLSSQKRRKPSAHSLTSRRGATSRRAGRHCASRPRSISPAPS